MAVYAVSARPAEVLDVSTTPESVDARQGWNQQGQPIVPGFPGYSGPPNSVNNYPAGQPIDPVVGNIGRPAYAYDNAFPDQVNFPGVNGGVINMPSIINLPFAMNPGFKQGHSLTGFAQTGSKTSGGVSASASAVSTSTA